MAVVPLLEGVARHASIGFHFSAQSFSDSGSIDHAFCETLPLDRAQGTEALLREPKQSQLCSQEVNIQLEQELLLRNQRKSFVF